MPSSAQACTRCKSREDMLGAGVRKASVAAAEVVGLGVLAARAVSRSTGESSVWLVPQTASRSLGTTLRSVSLL